MQENSELKCKCGGKRHLTYYAKPVTLDNGRNVYITDIPVLKCSTCHDLYQIEQVEKLVHYFANKCIPDAVSECSFSHVTKRCINNAQYIASKVDFIFDKSDYQFIPGLWRETNNGFLTPVFFNIEVLIKYIYHPNYGLDIAANTAGYIYNDNKEHLISFGINENNRAFMWLGDICELPIEEQYYLRSENIPSDHSIASEFYESQIDCVWAEASKEKELLKKRVDFNEKVLKQYGFMIAQLDVETVRLAPKIQKLIINTEEAFADLIIPLNELFVEAINLKSIKAQLRSLKDKDKDKDNIRELKAFQQWLIENTNGIDIKKEIAPLFVLYDLRVVVAHLRSDRSKEEILKSCCERLGLSYDERDWKLIASTLINQLSKMYDTFSNALIVPVVPVTSSDVENDAS